MKFIVVGCGSIGRRHMKNLLSLNHGVVAVDINEEYRKWVEENLKLKTYSDFEKAIKEEKPEAAFVCTPPNTHISLAKIAVECGLHLFIEKPVSNDLKGIDDLIKKVKKKNLKAMVGYNQRFNDVIIQVKELIKNEKILYAKILFGQYLPDWRPWQDYRKSYTASKKMGGGIILDGSHELDYVRWLFGDAEKVYAFGGKLSSLEVETEDTAEIIMKMKNTIVNVHLDFVRPGYKRAGEAVSTEKVVEWNLKENKIIVFNNKDKKQEEINITQDPNDSYVKEIKHFIECIEENKEPLINLEDAKKTLKLALKIKKTGGM